MLKQVKKLIPVSVKSRVIYRVSPSYDEELERFRGKRKAVVALAADYANLGDVAITHAQGRFLAACLPEHEIVYFPCAATFVKMKALKRVCTPEDLITIVGGGNMMDRYASLEDARRFVIGQFPENRIVSFPQTMDYSETPRGRAELSKSVGVYARHRSLYLFAREPVSCEMMRKAFPGLPVALVPDIVLSLRDVPPAGVRQGVLLCLRDDMESAFEENARSAYLQSLVSALPDARMTDTVVSGPERLPISERVVQFESLLAEFRAAEAVVTDRLHGMIFAAITGTPCVVLENNNHKIRATYATWLKDVPFVRLQDLLDPAWTLDMIGEVRGCGGHEIGIPNLGRHFEPLRRAIVDIQ